MKFKYKPNEFIIQTIVNKVTGHISKHAVCKFDALGELETFDKKVIYILQNKVDCTWDVKDEESIEVKPVEVKEILDDEEIRKLAKEKGIKSWHVKKINNLKKELDEMEV